MTEIWKMYKKAYNARWGQRDYEVSNFGHVKINGVITEPYTTRNGYKRIGGFYVHKAVAELYIPNTENKTQVDHIDTNKANNKVDNLRWVTPKENMNNALTLKHISDIQKIIKVGTTHSEETKQKMRKKQLGENNSFYGKKHTIESRNKLSKNAKDRTWINKDNKLKFIKIYDLDLFLNKGWALGKKMIKI